MKMLHCYIFRCYCLFLVMVVSALVLADDNLALQNTNNEDSPGITTEQVSVQKYYAAINLKRKDGDNAGMVKLYDDLIENHREFFRKDGQIVTVMYHRAVAHGFPRLSEDRRKLFEEIWNETEFKQYDRIYNIGRMVVLYAYRTENYIIANKYAEELLSLLEENYDEIPEDVRKKYGIDTAYKEGLLYSARSKGHLFNTDGATAAYEKLLVLFPDSIFTEEALTEIKILSEISDKEQSIFLGPIIEEVTGGIDTEAIDKNVNTQITKQIEAKPTEPEPKLPVAPIADTTEAVDDKLPVAPIADTTEAVDDKSVSPYLLACSALVIVGVLAFCTLKKTK